MNVIEAPSPNFDARTAPPEILVLHYTGMRTGPEALERLRDPEAKVSCRVSESSEELPRAAKR